MKPGPRDRCEPGSSKKGMQIGLLDSLIAGTALHHGATLVTHNVRELGRVEGLKVVDWY